MAARAQAEDQTEEKAAPGELVMVKESRWSKFDGNLRDMPFHNTVFDNQVFNMFGETETAECIRHMKRLDASFLLTDFLEEIKHGVIPHLLSAYLEGEADEVYKQCGEAAFNSFYFVLLSMFATLLNNLNFFFSAW